MKTKIALFLSMCVVASFFAIPVYSLEKIVETKYFKNNPDLGGDVLINKSTKEVAGDKCYTTFEIEAKAGGSYFLSLWASPVLYPDGNYSSFDVYVNGTKTPEQVKFIKGNWQAFALSEKVNIEQGINTVAFSSTGKEKIPAVEFIRMSTDRDRAKISSEAYDNYLNSLLHLGQNPGAVVTDTTDVSDGQLVSSPTAIQTIAGKNADKGILVRSTGSELSVGLLLPDAARVSLTVSDLQGREVVSFLKEQYLSKGDHQYFASLPKGIYIVRYTVNGKTAAEKVLVK